MIIKLQLPATATATSRQRASKTVEQLTLKDRVKADRMLMAIIYLLGIVGAIVFA